jgi:hypothetical protein
MQRNTLKEPEKQINVREECDVLVAGAGTAGCVAAIAAARSGAKTILIEQLPLPSGTMTNGGIIANSFYSSYSEEAPNPKQVVAGIAKEIVDRVIEAGGCPGYTKIDEKTNAHHRPYIVVMDPEIYKVVITRMLTEVGVKLYLHTFLSEAVVEDEIVKAVIIQSKSGREAIRAKYFIDCTGDGDLAAFSGAENFLAHDVYHKAEIKNVGKVFSIANVNLNTFMDFAKDDGLLIELAQGKKYSTVDDYIRIEMSFAKSKLLGKKAMEAGFDRLLFLTIHENYIDFVNFIGKFGVDITNIEDFTRAELEMQEEALKFYNFAKENIPGFENAVFSHSANQLGIRASRIIRCDYSITNDEIVNSVRFDDEIGLFGFHDFAPRHPDTCSIRKKGYYGLPYRMILPKGVKNVFVAGRMVTEEPKSHMSTRNTISCMVQGQAAGTAAALCANQNVLPRDLKYQSLRMALEASGVLFEPKD